MILLDGSTLTIEQLLAIADRGETVALADAARARVRASRAVVDRRALGDEPAYGINTGFGSFAEVKIAPDALEALQLNLLRSHAAGLGDPLFWGSLAGALFIAFWAAVPVNRWLIARGKGHAVVHQYHHAR